MGKIQSMDLTWQPNKAKTPVLHEINLTLKEGGFYAIIGPNGSGKTSFLRHIMRFLPVMEGALSLDNIEIKEYKRMDLAKEIALVPQNTALDTSFTAYDIVMMGRNPHKKRFDGITKEDIRIVEQAMKLASCESLKDRPMQNLSGGEAQRVIVARAIAQDTPWLLLDEPVSNLDIKHQIELMETLKHLNESKKTSILAVLHDINLAAAYSNYVIMMKHGKVHFIGETKEAMTRKRLSEVYEISFAKVEHPISKQIYFMPSII